MTAVLRRHLIKHMSENTERGQARRGSGSEGRRPASLHWPSTPGGAWLLHTRKTSKRCLIARKRVTVHWGGWTRMLAAWMNRSRTVGGDASTADWGWTGASFPFLAARGNVVLCPVRWRWCRKDAGTAGWMRRSQLTVALGGTLCRLSTRVARMTPSGEYPTSSSLTVPVSALQTCRGTRGGWQQLVPITMPFPGHWTSGRTWTTDAGK